MQIRSALTTAIVALLALTTFASPAHAATFVDVTSKTAFAKEINWLADRGISTGWDTPKGRVFRPTARISREAMAAFLYRLAGSPAYAPPSSSRFVDVSKNRSFYKEISWLSERGISTGWDTSKGKTFRPLDPISREAMAAFMYRAAGSPGFSAGSTPFLDLDPGDGFYKEIVWMASQGITTGVASFGGCRMFDPKGSVTRDAMAAFMYRLVNGGTPGMKSSPCAPPSGAMTSARLTGKPHLHQLLQVSVSPYLPANNGYRWLRDGRPIRGATSLAYQVTLADVGKELRVIAQVKENGRSFVVQSNRLTISDRGSFQALYVVAKDQSVGSGHTDRIRQTFTTATSWLARATTNGTRPRWVRSSDGRIDVKVVRLPQTIAQLKKLSSYDMYDQLELTVRPNPDIILAFAYDATPILGGNGRCGEASLDGVVTKDRAHGLEVWAGVAMLDENSCPRKTGSAKFPGNMSGIAAHEMMHSMGADHVSDSPRDLMYPTNDDGAGAVDYLDYRHDDYYLTRGRGGKIDIARSPFWESAKEAAARR